MKQTLSLKLGQQLTMTPQLQQAIRLLQLSCIDLQQEIQDTLEINPMLELDEDESAPSDAEVARDDVTSAESSASAESEEPLDGLDLDLPQPIPDDLPVDTNWDEVYETGSAPTGSSSDEDWNFDDRNAGGESLQDHLHWQLNLTPMSDVDRMIATAIIDAINADGMFVGTIEEIMASLQPLVDPGVEIERDEVVAVLKRIQQFDPIGVGARDLAECLMLQLNQLPDDTPWRAEALAVAADHLELLAARDFTTLKRKTRLDEDDLSSVVQLIQSLNPRPGSAIAGDETEYIAPDVIVTKKNGRWSVERRTAAGRSS